jgi:hypothetical protein
MIPIMEGHGPFLLKEKNEAQWPSIIHAALIWRTKLGSDDGTTLHPDDGIKRPLSDSFNGDHCICCSYSGKQLVDKAVNNNSRHIWNLISRI